MICTTALLMPLFVQRGNLNTKGRNQTYYYYSREGLKDFHFGHSDFLIYFTVLAKQDTLILVVNFIFRFEVDFIFILINLA